jgi:predicted ABC-type ATPase
MSSVLFGNAREDDAGATYAGRFDGKSVSELIASGQTLGQAITGVDIGNFQNFIPLVKAAFNSSQVDDLMVAEANRKTQYFDGVNKAIFDKTGVTIPNPNRDGFRQESDRLYRQQARQLQIAQNRGEDPGPGLLADPAEALWERRVAEIVRQRPELADVIGAAKIQNDPFLSSRATREELQKYQAEAGLVPSVAAGLIGGLAATARSPVDATMMVAGGGAGTANTGFGRFAQVFTREALINGAMSLLAQPAKQELANLSGEASGFWQAAQEIGITALFGGLVGGGAQLIREFRGLGVALPPKVQTDFEAVVRSASGQGTPEDFATAAKALNLTLDDATRREMEALARSIEIERAAETPPPGITPDAHNTTLAGMIRHAEDPAQHINPPPLPRPIDAEDAAVRAALPATEDPAQLVAALRGDTRLAVAAATSDSPDLAILGRLALMDERAADLALGGVLPADQVAHVGALLGEPAEQMGALQALVRMRAADLDQVAARVREEAAAQRIREATRRNLPTPEEIDRIAPEPAPGAAPGAKAGEAGVPTPEEAPGAPGASVGRGGATPEQMKADLEAKLRAGADMETLLSHPAILEAEARMRAIPETKNQPGYGSKAFEAARRFLFGTEEVIGYPAAIARLYQEAARWAGGEVRQDRRATIVLGPPAAGKSTLAEAIAGGMRARIIDSDEAKAVLPEFQGGLGANATHDESKRIMDQVRRQAIDRGDNIILPQVGADPEKIQRVINALTKAGYTVDLANLAVPKDIAAQRMVSRFLRSGRLIAPDYVREVGELPTRTYNLIKENRSVERAQNFDGTKSANDVANEGAAWADLFGDRRGGGRTVDQGAGGAGRPDSGGAAGQGVAADRIEPPPTKETAAPDQADLFAPGQPFDNNPDAQLKPVATPSGEARLVTPDEYKAELDRPAHLSDAVMSCKE